ncbi:LLM class flavin-dependent oxidoreductase [Prauserella cavernicola]|uniref:LLM class flavin-dependent oxidoreductase n=1 Tax=Prauserella cavernicola TaxID=2800127 RepID=A0A934V3M7_9PSEU|nr:LLM class flavin-dependent oxidoreductase [Prauserella cavernicola]MBK1783205.1 LLM class flavin-dependent oxidoreductase [Prauserella cavernicola]
MRFGIFLTNQQPIGADQRQALEDQLSLLRAARDGGWDSVFAGQHYLSEGLTHIQPLPYLARLAAEAGELRVGIGILLLALQNPVEVAENYAALDVITGGRLIFGVGLGYREVEYAALGVPPEDKVRRFESNLDVVRRLWAGDTVGADLPWCRLDGARLGVLPVQRPGPPVWMAANSDGAVRRAARLTGTWMINPHATLGTVRRQAELFRAEAAAHGVPEPAERPAMREIFCAETRERAVELAGPYLSGKYRTYARWGQDRVMPDRESFEMPYDQLAEQRFVVGSPEDCVRALLPWRDELGVDHLLLRTHWAGMPVEHSLNSVRLLSEAVLPALRT